MDNPIVIRYRENGSEIYAVHADGAISRPGIKMRPSGRWIMLGVANSRGVRELDLPELFRYIRDNGATGHPFFNRSLQGRLYVRDLDCGTMRDHGAAISSIWIDPAAPADALERLEKAHNDRAWQETQKWAEREQKRKKATPLYCFAKELEGTLDSVAESLIGWSDADGLLRAIVERMKESA